jgi:hypothetical protein
MSIKDHIRLHIYCPVCCANKGPDGSRYDLDHIHPKITTRRKNHEKNNHSNSITGLVP